MSIAVILCCRGANRTELRGATHNMSAYGTSRPGELRHAAEAAAGGSADPSVAPDFGFHIGEIAQYQFCDKKPSSDLPLILMRRE